jgi:polyphosphate glucokinase
MRAFGVDVGGSGVKGALVDLRDGSLLTDRFRTPTPQPSLPEAVMDIAAEMVAGVGWDGPVGCAIPAVVRHGVAQSAANIDDRWIGTDAAALLAERTGSDVHVLNDADAAGVAEMQFGAGIGHDQGVVILLTFGTGIGSAMFVDGHLFPNTELGHLQLHGDSAEKRAAARLREEKELSWKAWIERVNEYLHHVEFLFSPDRIIFGGGISKRSDRFLPDLVTRAPIVPAALRNNAGIVGSAGAAYERFGGQA